jgi:DNA-binding transcriptional MerR regulator
MMMIGQAFSATDVATLAGITPRLLESWLRKGIVRPSLQDDGLHGVQRWFSFSDLFAAHLAASLRKAGLSLSTAKKATRLLYEDEQHVTTRMYLIIQASDVRLVDRAEAERLLMRSSVAIGCDLIAAAQQCRAEIDRQMIASAVRESN